MFVYARLVLKRGYFILNFKKLLYHKKSVVEIFVKSLISLLKNP